jgi:cyclopropane fatty-acyl-phospholipid synthase-like methyltransferase
MFERDRFGRRRVIGAAWAHDHGFKMTAPDASKIVIQAATSGMIRGRVLDLGCGQKPRNSIYLASHYGCEVHGVDLEPVQVPDNTPDHVRTSMLFREASVLDIGYRTGWWDAIVSTRVFQYLSLDELSELCVKMHRGVRRGGVLVANYTASGGILKHKDTYKVPMYEHPIEEVQSRLEQAGFTLNSVTQGADQSTNVPHAGTSALTYDLIAKR